MEFEWSEARRLAVLGARRLDFLDGHRMFDVRPVCTALSPRGGKERWVSIGELDNEMIAVVWTRRGSAIRIITMRKARDEEKEAIPFAIRRRKSMKCWRGARAGRLASHEISIVIRLLTLGNSLIGKQNSIDPPSKELRL